MEVRHAPERNQRGMSLIGLLIGLLISGICMLGGLTLYRDLVQVTADSNYDTALDGQIASAMVQMQLHLQEAGFGLDNSMEPAIDIESHIDQQSFYWRRAGDPTAVPAEPAVVCRGLRESAITIGDTDFQMLHLLTAANCSVNGDLKSMNWQLGSELARFQMLAKLEDYLTPRTQKTLFDFNLVEGDCSPYGAGAPAPHRIAEVSAPSSILVNNVGSAPAGISDSIYRICLPNTL